MTIAQFIVAYAVCWWLVLFMLLPAGAAPAPTPGKGHAPSAPANPRLRLKFRRATLLAFIPTLLIYLVATNVKAQETIYHVGSGCKTLNTHIPAEDLNVRDGYGTGGKKVASANLGGNPNPIATDTIAIPLELPSTRYLNGAQTGGANNPPP
jgi:predicted secreted protein